MKVALRPFQKAYILSVEGAVDAKGSLILKAGIGKLLKDGKHMIMVEFAAGSSLDDSGVVELAKLDHVARELAGGVVVVSQDAAFLTKITSHKEGGKLGCFQTPELASAVFQSTVQAPTTVGGGDGASKAELERLKEESKKLKETIKEKETGEIGKVKAENARLTAQVKSLEEQLLKMLIKRRDPPDEQTYIEKIKLLEAKVEEYASKPKDQPA